MPDPVLSLANASLTLRGNTGPVEILRGVTLDVAEGESVGLVGPSGSGKSSLLMLMGGLERAISIWADAERLEAYRWGGKD